MVKVKQMNSLCQFGNNDRFRNSNRPSRVLFVKATLVLFATTSWGVIAGIMAGILETLLDGSLSSMLNNGIVPGKQPKF